MKKEVQGEEILKEAIHQSVEGKGPTIGFEKIWEESQKRQVQSIEGMEKMNKKINKKKIFAVAIIAATLSVTTLSAQYTRKVDDITYTFKNDKKVLGPWTVVDFVEKESEFKPGKSKWKGGEGHLRLMDFRENGELVVATENNEKIIEFVSVQKWTKDHIISDVAKVNSKYTIKTIEGKNYMFYEYKGSDYCFEGKEPYLYVLEQGRHIETLEARKKADDTNVPFENDEAMKGTWVAVDFVKEIEDFKVGKRQYLDSLWVESLVLEDHGGGMINVSDGSTVTLNTDIIYWTKGAIVSKVDQTVSECVIKEKKGETYMFYEWKSEDYLSREFQPYYYVLKKQK